MLEDAICKVWNVFSSLPIPHTNESFDIMIMFRGSTHGNFTLLDFTVILSLAFS